MFLVMQIDSAIDRLIAALERAGAPTPLAPRDLDVLHQIEASIAPLALPTEVRAFWTRVDPATIAIAPYPPPTSPAFALDSWTESADEFSMMVPKVLFPIARESHGHLMVELESDGGAAGTVFECGYGGPFHRRFDSVADWLGQIAALVEAGGYERHELPGGQVRYLDDAEVWERLTADYATDHTPHWLYGDLLIVEEGVPDWPVHWRRASGLDRPGLEGDDLGRQLVRDEEERTWQKNWIGVLKVKPVPDRSPDSAVAVTPSRPVESPYVLTVHGVDGVPWVAGEPDESGEIVFCGSAGSDGFGLIGAYVRTSPKTVGPPPPGEFGICTSGGLTIVNSKVHCDFINGMNLPWLASFIEPKLGDIPAVLAGRRPEHARHERLPEEIAWERALGETGSIVEAVREACFASRYGGSTLAVIALAVLPPVDPPPVPTEPISPESLRETEPPRAWPPQITGCRFLGDSAAVGFEEWLALNLVSRTGE